MSSGTANRSRIEPRPEFAKIVRIDDSYARPDSVSTAAQINGRFDRLMIQSGTSTAPGVACDCASWPESPAAGPSSSRRRILLGTAAGLTIGASCRSPRSLGCGCRGGGHCGGNCRVDRRTPPGGSTGTGPGRRLDSGPPTLPCRSPTRSGWLSGDCGWGLTLKRRSPTSPNARAFTRCRCS